MTDLFDLGSIAAITPPRKPEEKSTYLFYGMPGSGKTSLAGSAIDVAAMSPVLLLDFENGSSALSRKYPDVDVVHIKEWGTAVKVIEALANNPTKYKTIIFDTIGEAQEQIIIWSEQVFRKGDKENSYAKWADAWEQIAISIKGLHNTDMNVIALAHLELDRDAITNKKTVRPAFEGKKSHIKLPQVFDVIGYLSVQEDAKGAKGRVLQFLPEDDVVAKDRNGVFPEYVPHPTFQKLYGHVTAGIDS